MGWMGWMGLGFSLSLSFNNNKKKKKKIVMSYLPKGEVVEDLAY